MSEKKTFEGCLIHDAELRFQRDGRAFLIFQMMAVERHRQDPQLEQLYSVFSSPDRLDEASALLRKLQRQVNVRVHGTVQIREWKDSSGVTRSSSEILFDLNDPEAIMIAAPQTQPSTASLT